MSELKVDSAYVKKIGMAHVFNDSDECVPVTLLQFMPMHLVEIKTTEKHGYSAVKVGFNEKREILVNKPTKGVLAKAGISNLYKSFFEVRLKSDAEDVEQGAAVSFENIEKAQFVDVTSKSKGKGFQGVMKKFNFAGGPASHGSRFHRKPGSIGNRATPGKVFKNKKMPGQLGNKTVTIQNLEVVSVNKDLGVIAVKGSVPGSKNSFVRISLAKKKVG